MAQKKKTGWERKKARKTHGRILAQMEKAAAAKKK